MFSLWNGESKLSEECGVGRFRLCVVRFFDCYNKYLYTKNKKQTKNKKKQANNVRGTRCLRCSCSRQGTLVEGYVKDTCWLLTSHQWGQRDRRRDKCKTHLRRTQPHWPASTSALSAHLPIRLSCHVLNPLGQLGRIHSHLRFKAYQGTIKDYYGLYGLNRSIYSSSADWDCQDQGTSRSRWFLPNFPRWKTEREKKPVSLIRAPIPSQELHSHDLTSPQKLYHHISSIQKLAI